MKVNVKHTKTVQSDLTIKKLHITMRFKIHYRFCSKKKKSITGSIFYPCRLASSYFNIM